MFFGTWGASWLGNTLAGKGIVRAGSRNKKGKGIVRAGYKNKMDFLMPPHPLTNFEIQKYYQNEPRFNSVYSINNLPKNKGWGLCNKPWWVCRCWYTLDCFIL